LPFFGNTYYSYGDPGIDFAPSYNQGSWSWYISNTGSAAWQGIGLYSPTQNNLNDNQWHNLVHVFERSGDAVTYLDGVKVNTTAIVTGQDWDFGVPGRDWLIGQAGDAGYAEPGTFAIDDIGFWRRTLTDYEAQSIYIVGSQYGRSFDTTAPLEVKLTIAVNGSNITIGWGSGTLQSTDALTGQWQTVSGANPPSYTTAASGAARFYRAKVN
jgi:hypothetical protein